MGSEETGKALLLGLFRKWASLSTRTCGSVGKTFVTFCRIMISRHKISPVEGTHSPDGKEVQSSISTVSSDSTTHSPKGSLYAITQDDGLHSHPMQPGLEVRLAPRPESEKIVVQRWEPKILVEENQDSGKFSSLRTNLVTFVKGTIDQHDVVGRRRRQRRLGLIAAMLLILIVLIAILGAVFGVRAKEAKEAQGASSQAQAADSNHSPLNGTGIVFFNADYLDGDHYPNIAAYQDADARINIVRINVTSAPSGNTTSGNATSASRLPQVRVDQPFALTNVSVARGTALAGYVENLPGGVRGYRLVYVCPEGYLSEIRATSQDIRTWAPSNLGIMEYRAPTNRSAGGGQMSMAWNKCFGEDEASGGFRLWAPSEDGRQIRQYGAIDSSYGGSWSNSSDTAVPSALGGGAKAFVQFGQSATSCDAEWALLSTDPYGRLRYQTAATLTNGSNANANANATQWPAGPEWGADGVPPLVPGGPVVESGSEIAVSWGQEYRELYYESECTLQKLQFVNTTFAGNSIQTDTPAILSVRLLSGTAMSGAWLCAGSESTSEPDPVPGSGSGSNCSAWLMLFQSSASTVDWYLWSAGSGEEAQGNLLR